MKRRALIVITALVVACGGKSCREASVPTPALPERLVVIFADVTSSLTAEQVVSVQSHVEHIIEALPPRTTVYVFSIGRDTETAREIEHDATPIVDSEAAKNRLVQWRATFATQVRDDLERLHARRKDTEPGTLSSCITTALRRAASLTTRSTRQVDIFIVSDMIEECETSLLGGQLTLMKRNIDEEIRHVTDLKSQPVSLRHATITIVRPQYNIHTSGQNEQPSAADLERFWRGLLVHCETDSKRVYFGADLPPSDELFPTIVTTASATSTNQ
jgi:hypothetical protein